MTAGAARYAGARVGRVEDPRLLTGRGRFVADVAMSGMLHAAFVRSRYPRARIERVGTDGAVALPGVVAVFTASDLNPDVRARWHTLTGPDAVDVPQPPLAEGEARFVGDPIALVVAEDPYVVEDAVDLVEVDLEPLPAAVDYATEHAATVHDAFPDNVLGGVEGPPGAAAESAFAEAAHIVAETISQHAHVPAPMETRGMVVHWSAGELTIHVSTQSPHEFRMFCARLLGLPEHCVRVVAADTGGAFGQKIFVQREDSCLMLAARKVPGPLRWIEDRRENLMAGGMSRHEHGTARLGFDDDGRIVAARLDLVQDVGAYPTPAPVNSAGLIGSLFPGPYRIGASTFTTQSRCSNIVGRSPYRGPWEFETLARELLLDIAARRMDLDPIELRRRNMLTTGDLPYTNPNGMLFDKVSPRETFDAALERLDYEGFRRLQRQARDEGRLLGVGTSTYIEPTAGGFGMYASEGASIRVEPTGVVHVAVTGGSAGNSVETTVTQLAADAIGVDIDDVRIIQGDTAVTPYGAGTGGSRSGPMTAGAIARAGRALRDKIATLAAHRLEAAVDDIEVVDSRAFVRGTPSRHVTIAELAGVAYFATEELPEGMSAGLEVSERYTTTARFAWANATHVCTCEVDPDTGGVTVLRYIVAEDCGPMINPSVVEGQIAGGTVQGIGGVLYEHLVYDEDGNPLATTFMDYLLPTTAEVPDIEFVHVETSGPGEGGYKGVGEGGAIGAPAAVANAVADALSPLGVTVTELPLDPARVLAVIQSAPG